MTNQFFNNLRTIDKSVRDCTDKAFSSDKVHVEYAWDTEDGPKYVVYDVELKTIKPHHRVFIRVGIMTEKQVVKYMKRRK